MKRFTNALFAAALLAGGASLAVQPAAAQKKDKKAEGPALKLSKEVQAPAAAAQTALAANDLAAAETSIAQAEAAAKTDDERYISAALRLNLEAKKIGNNQGSDAALAVPLKVLVTNPKTPPADIGRYNYELGRIATNAKDNAAAAQYFAAAQAAGYTNPNMSLQILKAKADAGDLAGASAEMDKVIAAQTAAGQKPGEDLYRFMIAKSNQKRNGALTYQWLKKYVEAYPTAKNWRDVVTTFGLTSGGVATLDKGQKVDLFRLLRNGKALADQYDYEIYAQSALDLGIPWEAKSVLNEGKAAGKIPASSSNATSLLQLADKSISNEGSLSGLETRAKAAANGKLAASTADAYLGSGNYAKAVELYRVALQKGQVDADAVNTRLGIALAYSGDKAAARTAFEAVKGQPRADLAGLWIEYLDHPPVG
ncbi:hypothetical protein SAMN05216382_2950 [Sphingomonas palmae]|uniref:Tetratricopeptide repeat-containing protein n=1 Tax=Sphingomonas palmae TaxID=1855283 RepID=A0A1H7U6G5_9SPHN|nr:hypothetical protein [Sphingomonas palmae]SEL92662.1 hypothetical protein SAMN05216382_2950 [Sphingomonas palmae]